jgi:hypothetical protein
VRHQDSRPYKTTGKITVISNIISKVWTAKPFCIQRFRVQLHVRKTTILIAVLYLSLQPLSQRPVPTSH